ncbi:MAG: LamG domain-containing protein [Blastocatellales bacterium]
MNYGQLNLLSSGERAALLALGQVRVAEIVQITWPDPDGVVNYASWQLDQDPGYSATITPWLNGRPLVVAFAPEGDDAERFHPIINTAAINDDVVQFRFSNKDQEFARLCYEHRGGARVEIFYHFPQLPKTISVWWGHLRTPEGGNVNEPWVNVTSANGIRSSQNLVASTAHGNCDFPFGGELPVLLRTSEFTPCDYDPDNGRGEYESGTTPFPSCPEHNIPNCKQRWGPVLWEQKYGGMNAVVEDISVGLGDHRTISRTQGQQTLSDTPARIVAGEFRIAQLHLLDFRKETNPSQNHLDKGTLLVLAEVSLGPVEAVTDIEVLDRPLPRPDGLGLELRLGAQDQLPTGFSANTLGYNRRAHFRGDLNPINPAGYHQGNITTACTVKGYNQVAVYTDPTTYTRQWTNSRAWWLHETFTNHWWGYRLDPVRLKREDFLHLETLGRKFNCDMQGRTIQQQVEDICRAGMYYLPFWYDGKVRVLPQEEIDFNAGDIPVFTDNGANPNILLAEDGATSTLEVDYLDDDKLVNKVGVVFNDKEIKYKERTIKLADEKQQQRVGELNGDNTMRNIERVYSGYGLTSEPEARELRASLLNVGEFGNGGLANNLRIKFDLYAFNPDALNLHPNKIIKVVSDQLTVVNYRDLDGNPFTHFRVTSLERDRGDRLTVKAQAYVEVAPDACVPITRGSLTFAGGFQVLEQLSYPANPSTWGGWIRVTDLPDGGSFSSVLALGDGSGWSIVIDDGGRLGFRTDTGIITGSTLTLNEWNHVLITTDTGAPGARKVYLNGELDIDTTGVAFSAPSTLWAGNDSSFFHAFIGQMARMRAWTRILDEAEIAADASSQCYEPENLTDIWGDWPLNAAPDGANDSQGSGRNWIVGGNIYTTDNLPPLFWCEDPCGMGPTLAGGSSTTQTPAPSRAVIVDRLISDAQLFDGVLGFYFAAAPTNTTGAWAATSLYVDRGGGYVEIAAVEIAATLGDATTVLPGTTLGSETVRVQLQPGQTLPTYSPSEITAGKGYYYLGGEIFQARTATQITSSPNVWELSNLTNRGARCTSGVMGTHVVGDDLVSLDEAVVFVALPATEIGQTRNYKAVTAGQNVSQATAFSHTFTAPNFTPTTPADYSVTFDGTRNEVIHAWTPITDPCLVGNELEYEIRIDASGSPGALLWRGTSSEWRESVNASGTRNYHFRAVNKYSNGNYVTDSITFTITPGAGGSPAGHYEPLTNGDDDAPEIVFAEGDVIMVFVEG